MFWSGNFLNFITSQKKKRNSKIFRKLVDFYNFTCFTNTYIQSRKVCSFYLKGISKLITNTQSKIQATS